MVRDTEMTRTFGDTNVFFYFSKFDRNRGSQWMQFCLYMSHRISLLSCLQINWQPFYLCQLLKFHPFDWLIEIYLQTEGQGTHHKMVSLQPMPGFPLCWVYYIVFNNSEAYALLKSGLRISRKRSQTHVCKDVFQAAQVWLVTDTVEL